MCDWSNGTDKSPASWRMATVNRRPSNLPDKTFGAPGWWTQGRRTTAVHMLPAEYIIWAFYNIKRLGVT